MQNLWRTSNIHAYFSDFGWFDTFDFILYNHSQIQKHTFVTVVFREYVYVQVQLCFIIK